MKNLDLLKVALFLISTLLALPAGQLMAQENLAWEATPYFQYKIEGILINKAVNPYQVKVIFSVLEPTKSQTGTIEDIYGQRFWDILNASPFKQSLSRLSVDLGWNTKDFVNTGSANEALTSLTAPGSGAGPALPIQISALTKAKPCGTQADCPIPVFTGRYFVTTSLPSQATGTGRVAIEGRPAWPILVNGTTTLVAVPVKNIYKDFAITDLAAAPRRAVIDFAKCQRCHDGTMHDETWIPRLSLHGGNRTEEPGVCVVCHNPNMTDIPYRTSGSEESIDLKRFAHSIHAGNMRRTPLVVVGFRGTITDFSQVRFPGELKNCMNCHIDIDSKGTFELPLRTNIGSTIDTRSRYSTSTTIGYVDVNPANDLKITSTAAVCSACHDSTEVKSHMVKGGASFSATQPDIDSGRLVERCVNCHGRGKAKDVRKVHKDEYSD